MNSIIENIISRRSVRKYKPLKISGDDLDVILKAACYAPSGMNRQTAKFICVENDEILTELNELVKSEIIRDSNDFLKKFADKCKSPGYSFFYNAPVLIVAADLKNNGNALADCACALENIFLSAHSLGIASCYINQLRWLNENQAVNRFMQKLGMPEDYRVFGSAALGYGEQPPVPERKPGRVKRIL